MNKFVALILVIGVVLFPNYALGGNAKSDAVAVASPGSSLNQSRTASSASSGKTIKQLMNEVETHKAEAEAELAQATAKEAEIVELKAKRMQEHNAALQDPNSSVQSSAEVLAVLGEVEVDEKPAVRFMDEKLKALDALSIEAYEPRLLTRLKTLGEQLRGVCQLSNMNLVTAEFTIVEGKLLRGAAELRELSPATPEDRVVANCITQGLANSVWENFGENINVFVIMRFIGNP